AELHGDIRKKGLGPELHGDAGGDDHRDSRNRKAGLSQLGLGLTARADYSRSYSATSSGTSCSALTRITEKPSTLPLSSTFSMTCGFTVSRKTPGRCSNMTSRKSPFLSYQIFSLFSAIAVFLLQAARVTSTPSVPCAPPDRAA